MSYQDKLYIIYSLFKEELEDRIRYAEVDVESTQKAEDKFTFNLGVLKGLKEAKKLIEEIENELQR